MYKFLLFMAFPFFAIGQIQIGSDINGPSVGGNFGNSTALSTDGHILAIGANLSDANGLKSGVVTIYENSAGSWVQKGNAIVGEAAGNQCGWSVSLSADGTVVAVGAPKNMANGTNSGHVRVYSFVAGAWSQLGSDIDGQQAGEQSGWSISLSSNGKILAVGCPFNTNNGNDSGLVRVYKNINNAWVQQGTDINSGWYYDNSGRSVSLSSDGTTVAIGAPYNSLNGAYTGLVKVYKNTGGAWTQVGADIRGTVANGISGYSVSLAEDGNTVAVGAIGNSSTGNNAGYVKVFGYAAGTWTQLGATINGSAINNACGKSVALSADGTIVATGADYNNDNGTEAGYARIFKYNTGVWTQIGTTITGLAAGDHAGYSVSLAADGNTVAVASPFNATNGVGAGQVRVYDITQLLSASSFDLPNFSVYPNPVADVLTISLKEETQFKSCRIYNLAGQLVRSSTVGTVSMQGLSSGTYFIEVTTSKGRATKSVIKK